MNGQNMNESLRVKEESNLYSYHLTLFTDADEMIELWLPKMPEGFFKFSNSSRYDFLNVIARDNQWYAVCREPAFFKEVPIADSCEILLRDGELLKISNDDREYLLLVERVIPKRSVFRNYSVRSDIEIKIGSQADSDIFYRGPFVSRTHAILSRRNGVWKICCFNKQYGMYINGEKMDEATLCLGDIVYIMALKIIIGNDFLSINSGLGSIEVNPGILQDENLHRTSYYHYYNEDSSENAEKYFNPAPRKRREMEGKTITVEGPPMSMSQKQIPLMLRMGSSVFMGGAAALAGNFMTLITSVLFPFLSSKYTDNQRNEYEKLRNTKYNEYLQKKRQEIEDTINYEQTVLNKKFPCIVDATTQDLLMKHLWERRPCDSDFLQLRVGTGRRPLSAKIDYPNKGFELETDTLEEKMLQLAEAKYSVENAPIILSLVDTYICGVQGKRQSAISFLESIMLQIAAFHSYDEVKMIFLLNQNDLKQMDAVRYLPHTWDDMHSIRFVATNEAEAYFIGEYIKGQIDTNTDRSFDLKQVLKKRPYYIIFALNKKTFDGHEFFKEILSKDNNIGVSIITAFDFLVKESQKIITLDDLKGNVCTTMGIDGGDDEFFITDGISFQQKKQALNTISNISLKKITQAQAMPKMVTFLEMFNVGRIEQLNPLKRWRENNPVKSLAAPVGLGEDGTPFILDLHEKRQGPHGLVAGMTGSGKSEFLITYILSMAVNYHPDEVSFVLIDYKGGGLASAFDNPRTGVRLPHLAGTITNLDGNSIHRSLMSIESELVRRQRVFNEAAKLTNEGTMNISTYQKLYRAGKVDKPMSHLFIISDEFAELKQQQPEFLEKLISAARIGRSLGVHLILATQKPSGVVNDQIRSNTKFQVCLRVQERSDSMDMIKRPDAAELTDTGRFYLQVGYNEYFALGQSAWCGADYEPKDVVSIQRDDSIEFIDVTGQVIASKKPSVRKVNSGKKQLVAIVEYLHNLAKKENIFANKLWLDPLQSIVTLNSLEQEYGRASKETMQIMLGVVDDPMHQQKFSYNLDIQHNRNLLVVGSSGSGKTTFLQTFLYKVVTSFSPTQIQYYIMDFSSRSLKQFEKAPHCGAFITDEDESQIQRLFALVKEILEERRRKFSQAEVSNYDAYLAVEELPIILLVIDDFARIEEMRLRSDFLSALEDIMSNGVSYGIRVVGTISQINTCPIRLRRNAGEKIALSAKDKFAYSDILDKRCIYEPAKNPGRGMCSIEDNCYEFQTAIVSNAESDLERANVIRNDINKVLETYNNTCYAKRLNVIAEEQTYENFCSHFSLERIPLGIHLESMHSVAIPLQQLKNVVLYFGNRNGIISVINNLLYAFKRESGSVFCVARNQDSIFDNKDLCSFKENINLLSCSQKDIEHIISCLTEIITKRKLYRNEYCEHNGILDFTETDTEKKWRKYIRKNTNPVFVLFESFADLAICIDIQTAGVLSSFFDLCHSYNIYFVACTYPDDEKIIHQAKYPNGKENASEDEGSIEYKRRKEIRHIWEGVQSKINPDKFALLFGGQFHLQNIAKLPVDLQKIKEPCKSQEVDRFVMQYRGEIYKMLMPCEKSYLQEDEDERDIV